MCPEAEADSSLTTNIPPEYRPAKDIRYLTLRAKLYCSHPSCQKTETYDSLDAALHPSCTLILHVSHAGINVLKALSCLDSRPRCVSSQERRMKKTARTASPQASTAKSTAVMLLTTDSRRPATVPSSTMFRNNMTA